MSYKERRKKLYRELGNEGMLFLCSGFEINRSADDNYPFSVNRNFYYLTGIDQHDSYLVVDLKTGHETLYALDTDELLSRWIGRYYSHEELEKKSGIEDIKSSNDLTFFEDVFKNSKVFLDIENIKEIGGLNYGDYFKKIAFEINSEVIIENAYSHIIKLRAVKDDEEIKAIEKAIDLTNEALKSVMKNMKKFNNEREAQAHFEERIFSLGHGTPAFQTICGSGVNGTILHYHSNNDYIKSNSLVLMDLGARINYYNADITRTYPANGTFTPLQKKIYQIVLDCNKMIAKVAKPGISMQELHEHSVDFLAKACLKENLIKTYDEIKEVYFHRVSHHLGLDVHDPMGRNTILEKGNVISNEPGLYFSKLGIGIRIEDDLLISENGCRCLSENIIKEIDDIEKYMKD